MNINFSNHIITLIIKHKHDNPKLEMNPNNPRKNIKKSQQNQNGQAKQKANTKPVRPTI